jgi:site-specific DNA-cytosine methylase
VPTVLAVTERTRGDGRNLEWQEDIAYALDNPGEGGRSQTRLVAVPDPAYAVQGQGTRPGSGRHNQDTFVVAAPLRSRQSSPGVSMPGRGGEDDENLVIAGISENQRAETRLTDYASPVTAGGGKPGQGYPAALQAGLVRRLTPTECERLQGFPDGWTAGHADSSRYRMLGNAVCVPVAEWIGRRILP